MALTTPTPEAAIRALVELDSQTVAEIAEILTCEEAEQFADLFLAIGARETAAAWISDHAQRDSGDEDGRGDARHKAVAAAYHQADDWAEGREAADAAAEQYLVHLEQARDTARAMLATGSRSVTARVEHRDPVTGELVVDATATATREV